MCATDEHGTPIAVKAEREGVTPKQIADHFHKLIEEDLRGMECSFPIFSRTTDPLHYQVTQSFFLKLLESEYIYEQEVEQRKCPRCDRFLPDKAIDLMDESASRVRMYKNPTAKRAKEITKELYKLRYKINEPREEIEEDEELKEMIARETELDKELEAIRSTWDRENSPSVEAEDIAEVVSMLTGVPLMQLKLLLEKRIKLLVEQVLLLALQRLMQQNRKLYQL